MGGSESSVIEVRPLRSFRLGHKHDRMGSIASGPTKKNGFFPSGAAIFAMSGCIQVPMVLVRAIPTEGIAFALACVWQLDVLGERP